MIRDIKQVQNKSKLKIVQYKSSFIAVQVIIIIPAVLIQFDWVPCAEYVCKYTLILFEFTFTKPWETKSAVIKFLLCLHKPE